MSERSFSKGPSWRRGTAVSRLIPLLVMIVGLSAILPTEQARAQDDTTYYMIYKFYDAATHGRWRDCAKLVHPEDLRRFRGAIIDVISELSPTIEMEMDFAQQFLGTQSLEAARRMEPVRFFEKIVEASRQLSPKWFSELRRTDVAVGDFIVEGDTLRHYVVWEIYPIVNSQLEELTVFTLRSRGNRWYCTLSGFFEPLPKKLVKIFRKGPRANVRID